ncbi:MAG: hypothetical protein WC527_08720 [Candidatus Margulisiibacteriota bacterium]
MGIVDELQLQNEMDTVFGLRKPTEGSRPFTFCALYRYYTGDADLTGFFSPKQLPPDLRARMAINAGSFPKALANSLNRFLSVGYNNINYFDEILISQKAPANRLGRCAFIETGCWDDLPPIEPEAEDYPDMPAITEAHNPFDILQKGFVIPVSRKTIVNDNIGLLKRLILRAGHVSRKTHARYIWNMWINNDNCNDGTAWFSADHGNLGSDVVSISAVTAAITALAAMTEPGPSNDVMGIDLSKPQFHLVVASSIWDEAVKVNQAKYVYSANDLTNMQVNPCYHLFGDHNERIATPPFLTGTAWGVIRNKEEVPIIEMQYLNGKEEPEIVFERDPMSAINDDFFGLKIRFEFGGSISDYRGGYKSIP